MVSSVYALILSILVYLLYTTRTTTRPKPQCEILSTLRTFCCSVTFR